MPKKRTVSSQNYCQITIFHTLTGTYCANAACCNRVVQDVMFELFTKNWEYGYVTDFADFESLATQWSAVVTAASDTEDYVTAV